MVTKEAKVDSKDATLKMLELTRVPLRFARQIYDYTVTVPHDVGMTGVEVTKNDPRRDGSCRRQVER